jgi:aldehyde dehydrogenase (NAD+)
MNTDTTRLHELFELQGANRWRMAATTAGQRVARLERLRAAILKRQKELYAAVWEDFRKSSFETWLTEIFPSIEEIDVAVKRLPSWMRDKRVRGAFVLPLASGRLRYEPRGRVLIMSPWNYPFHLLVAPLVSAIAAGNVVIAKPSNKTPRTSTFISSLLGGLFPPEEVAVVEGPGAALGEALLQLPFDHIFFTGSPRVGARVGEAAARVHAGLTLELGGKSPTVLLPDADVGDAAAKVMWGKCLNAGQTCIAPDYLLCPSSMVGAFARAARTAVETFFGESEDEWRGSTLPRIVDQGSCRRMERLVKDAVGRGAVAEFGGRFDADERYAAPTLLTGVRADMEIMKEEIFGPILPVVSYDAPEEVVAFINSRPKPLALYIFARDKRAAHRLVAATTSGSVCINDLIVQVENPNLPFGGIGMSGTGSYHGFFGFKAFSHERNVVDQGPISIAKAFYPPYGRRSQRLLSGFIRKVRRLSRE